MSKILIIEDDIFLGDAFTQRLSASGYETRLVRDGASGLKEIRAWKPNLVLLDAILPRMNGFEMLEAKMKDSAISSIPVIIVSNSGQPAGMKRFTELGVKDYVVNTQFDSGEILIKIRLHLKEDSGVKDSVSERDATRQGTSEDLKGKKIMWVEDDKFLSDIIARKLSTLGCQLVHATEGKEALALAEKEMPDVILLDILLSGIDGFEILKRLKENPNTKHIPALMLSNLGQREDIEKGKKLGAARFMIKATVTLDEIVSEIKAVLAETKRT